MATLSVRRPRVAGQRRADQRGQHDRQGIVSFCSLVDRATRAVAFIASARGGVDIEQVARENPEDIHTLEVNFVQGLQPYQCRSLAFKEMGLSAKQAEPALTKIMLGLYKLFNEKDLSLVEVNPLAILASGRPGCARRQESTRTTTPSSAMPTSRRCATSRRKITPKQSRSSTTSTLRHDGRQHRLHGQWRRAGDGYDGRHQAGRWRAGELPRRRRRRGPKGA